MFSITDVYNIVLAKELELDWEDQDNLEQAYDTYSNLPDKKQKQFDSLINRALQQCKSDFDKFPDNYPDETSVQERDDIIDDIIAKLEEIFKDFLQ